MVDVLAATDGQVVSVGGKVLEPGTIPSCVGPRSDVIYLRDDRGWFYRYSHLDSIDPAVQLGARVKLGQKIGMLGKEGGSGGWSHLHFDIVAPQPSGRWGILEGYAFLWQAYHQAAGTRLQAVARLRQLAGMGETGHARCHALLELQGTGAPQELRVDLHRRCKGHRSGRRTGLRQAGAILRDAQGDRCGRKRGLRLYAGSRGRPRKARRPAAADPRRLLSDQRHQGGRRGDLQGPLVRHRPRPTAGKNGTSATAVPESACDPTPTSTSTPRMVMR